MTVPKPDEQLRQYFSQPTILPSLVSLAYKFVHNKRDAEDIVQDAIADLIHQKNEGIQKLQPFIKTVIVNKAKAHFTRNERRNSPIKAASAETKLPSDNFFSYLELKQLASAVKGQREALDYLLFEMNSEGYSYEEISRHTGETPVNLRQRMFVLRRWLKQNYKQ